METLRFCLCLLIVSLLEPSSWAKRLKLMELENSLDFGDFTGCYRECDGVPRHCKFNLTLSLYSTFSMHCGDCPRNPRHCNNKGCITAGGNSRPIYVANLALPGPAIHVCEGDKVTVRVKNSFPNEGASVHWHGVWLRGMPHMDGVPYISQCPIQPNNVFVYEFLAHPEGTHMWHSHIGLLETDGLFGPLVIRREAATDTHRHLYDEDLMEHTVVLWHLYSQLSYDYLPIQLYRNASVSGANILVNGKGRLATGDLNTPFECLHVRQGKRYRFRFIFNSAVYCPVQVSIDNHTMLAIASDGADFKPVRVDSLMMNAGERWDVVVHADQPADNYWIRIRACGDCGTAKSQVSQQAVLVYSDGGSSDSDLNEPLAVRPIYETSRREGRLLNPMHVITQDYVNNELVRVMDLENVDVSTHGDISVEPNRTLYVALSFKVCDDLVAPGPYPHNNDISFEYPAVPLILQRYESSPSSSSSRCDQTSYKQHCVGSFCSCTYTEKIKLGELVEIVLVDLSTDRTQDHPYHIHGTNVHVVAEGTLGANVSMSLVRELNERGALAKRLDSTAPLKDTVTVTSQGYTIIRMRLTNPGYWFFHCHVSNHVHLGMGMVLQVGEEEEMPPVPTHFPRCGDWSFEGFETPVSGAATLSQPLAVLAVLALWLAQQSGTK